MEMDGPYGYDGMRLLGSCVLFRFEFARRPAWFTLAPGCFDLLKFCRSLSGKQTILPKGNESIIQPPTSNHVAATSQIIQR